MNKWLHEVKNHSKDQIHTYCVEDQEWQRFRENLKGLTTQKKLQMLAIRRSGLLMANPDNPQGAPVLSEAHQCQIDNYLNALKRGGQLGSNFQVLR